MHKTAMVLTSGLALIVSACATQPTPAQRNAGIGAAIGAAAGAAVAGDDTEGALAGAALGAAAGYYTGCRQQGGCYIGGNRVASQPQYDAQADRRYFEDPNSQATYWENGDQRTTVQGRPAY